MEKEKWESLLIDYIDGTLTPAEAGKVEKELASNEELYAFYDQLREVMTAMDGAASFEPGKNHRERFNSNLASEVSKGKQSKNVLMMPWVYRIAAGVALVMIAVGLGYWINKSMNQARELALLKEEMETTKRMMFDLLANQNSATQRIVGATVAYEMERTDDEIVSALVKTLNEDPNTNVRLAALEALSKFYTQPHVRKALIASLSKQTDSMVQIMLIRILVEMKEGEIVNDLKNIIKNERMLPAVKDEAHAGLLKLS